MGKVLCCLVQNYSGVTTISKYYQLIIIMLFIMDENYFGRSQRIRIEMENTPDLIKSIITIFVEPWKGVLLGEPGTNDKVFRIGQTNGGIHVALRMPTEEFSCESEEIRNRYEMYCRIAETLWDNDPGREITAERPVNFCVGFMYRGDYGILTEDISDGGLSILATAYFGIVVQKYGRGRDVGKVIEEVMVDLINDSTIEALVRESKITHQELRKPKYFLPAAMVKLGYNRQ